MEDLIQPSINREGDEHPRLCSFCGKGEKSLKKLIALPPPYICNESVELPRVYICNECVDQCVEILAEGRDQEPGSGPG